MVSRILMTDNFDRNISHNDLQYIKMSMMRQRDNALKQEKRKIKNDKAIGIYLSAVYDNKVIEKRVYFPQGFGWAKHAQYCKDYKHRKESKFTAIDR